jgi:hypothetical protein
LGAVDPTEIVAILLGASEWPASSDLNSQVFARSKRRFDRYLLDPAGLGISADRRLDLFDSASSSTQIYEEIGKFLREKASNAKDLIVYFVGHGDFAGDQRDYVLLVQCSDPAKLPITTLRASDLATVIRGNAAHVRQHLLIDACFAAAAQEGFYGSAVSSALRTLREERVEMLCSSGMVLSIAPKNEECTPFSNAILDVLMLGAEEAESDFTLNSVGRLAELRIRETFGDKAAIPKFFPENVANPVAATPLFPNTASSIQWCAVLAESTQRGPGTHPLRQLANTMRTGFAKEISAAAGDRRLSAPRYIEAASTLATVSDLQEAIRVVCRSEVAVFDLTNYEPAVMLLLGIRSVARRGITVCVASASASVDVRESPFYFKDIRLVPYGNDISEPEVPIKTRICEGLRQLREAPVQYLDLPSFDSIRELWPDEKDRQSVRYFKRCLVLCSYSEDYKKNAWPDVSRYLRTAIRSRKTADETISKADVAVDPSVMRSIDMTSPRLVSHELFNAIRHTEFCIVDLSEWRANVLFELGVRLASSDLDPICIIGTGDDDKDVPPKPPSSQQRQHLLKLFAAHVYLRNDNSDQPATPFIRMLESHLEIRQLLYADKPWGSDGSLPPGSIYKTVWQYITPQYEPVASSVSKYLSDTERLYHVSDSKGRSPFIYPKTHPLAVKAEEHGRECVVAALLYLRYRHGTKKLREKDSPLGAEYRDLAYRVAGALLQSSNDNDKALGRRIVALASQLRGPATDVLGEAALTLEKVKVYRQLERFGEALRILEPTIVELQIELNRLNKKGSLENFEADRRNRVAATLSNCCGIRGGLYRRTGDLAKSLSSYVDGRTIEQTALYGISDSYNLVNALVLEILTLPKNAPFDSIITSAEAARSKVSDQVQADRHDQWWAWADLGMLHILSRHSGDAEAAYKRFWAAGARQSDFESSRSTLEQIRNVDAVPEDIKTEIDEMLRRIPDLKPS